MECHLFITGVLVFALFSCKKEKSEYPKNVRYEASCDTCTVRYYVSTNEYIEHIHGPWSHSFTLHNSQYLHVNLYELDSAEVGWVKIFVEDRLLQSSSTDEPSPSGLVLATGYP